MKAKILITLTSFLLAFQVIGGLWGGIGLIADPSGQLMQMPVSMMDRGPFHNFLVPGLILLLLLAVFPALAFAGLVFRPGWKWASLLNIYPDRHWGWTYTLYTGIMLIVWIDVQLMVVGSWHFLHGIFGGLGILLVILCLLPAVMKHYQT